MKRQAWQPLQQGKNHIDRVGPGYKTGALLCLAQARVIILSDTGFLNGGFNGVF